jgi:endoglucanase
MDIDGSAVWRKSTLARRFLNGSPSHNTQHPIRVNSVGFRPDAPKHATVAGDASRFRVVDAGGSVVLDGELGETREADGETVRIADFTDLAIAGEYRIEDDLGRQSAPFRIGDDAYAEAFVTATRAMYLWRCLGRARGPDVQCRAVPRRRRLA